MVKRKALPLYCIWLIQSVLVGLLVYLNPNHFTTIDSGFYLESAASLLDGKGLTYTEGEERIWNGFFPLGYPASIALVALGTGVSVLWASKVVNLLASAVFLFLLQRWFGVRQAAFTGSLLLMGQFVKLWAHTWSEPLFLVLLFAWSYQFFKFPQRYVVIFLLGIALLLVRYAGIFIIPLSFLVAAYDYSKNNSTQARLRLGYGLIWALGFGAYLLLNYSQSGEWYGGARFEASEPIPESILSFTKGLLNEAFLFRDTGFGGWDILFAIGLAIQLGMLGIWIRNRNQISFAQTPVIRLAWTTAIGYLIFLFLIRLFSPFDAPGYRLLSPFSFLFFWGILMGVHTLIDTPKGRLTWGGIILVSWLHLLPQSNLESKLKPIWQWLSA